jgi:hypothetical protein
MGQAKIRSEEIKALKLKNANKSENIGDKINLIAIKHLRNGGKQVAFIDYSVSNFNKSKDQLLYEICNHEWGGEKFFKKITNYFSLTSNYHIYKMMGMHGFIVNFYESDNDYGGAYSCRQIIAINDKESFDREVKKVFDGSSFVFTI